MHGPGASYCPTARLSATPCISPFDGTERDGVAIGYLDAARDDQDRAVRVEHRGDLELDEGVSAIRL